MTSGDRVTDLFLISHGAEQSLFYLQVVKPSNKICPDPNLQLQFIMPCIILVNSENKSFL